jgi:hypothetical protein
VKLFIALAPIARLDHSTNEAMVMASQIYPLLSKVVQFTGLYNLLPNNKVSEYWNAEFCFALPHFCEKSLEGFYDFKSQIDNSARIADKMTHSPQGSGWRCLIHYA